MYLAHMSNAELIQIANKWFAAFNAKKVDNLIDLYHEDAQHYSPKLKVRHPDTNGLIQGKTALRTWWADAFERLPSLQYEIVRLTPYEDRIFMEYTRKVDTEDDLYVGEVLEVKGGLISASRVFHS